MNQPTPEQLRDAQRAESRDRDIAGRARHIRRFGSPKGTKVKRRTERGQRAAHLVSREPNPPSSVIAKSEKDDD